MTVIVRFHCSRISSIFIKKNRKKEVQPLKMLDKNKVAEGICRNEIFFAAFCNLWQLEVSHILLCSVFKVVPKFVVKFATFFYIC